MTEAHYHVIVGAGTGGCLLANRSDWMFETDSVAGAGSHSLGYPRGKVLGGASAINAVLDDATRRAQNLVVDLMIWSALVGDCCGSDDNTA